MKKFFTLLVTAVAVVALMGCAKKSQQKEDMPQQDQGAYQSGNSGKLSSSKLGK